MASKLKKNKSLKVFCMLLLVNLTHLVLTAQALQHVVELSSEPDSQRSAYTYVGKILVFFTYLCIYVAKPNLGISKRVCFLIYPSKQRHRCP